MHRIVLALAIVALVPLALAQVGHDPRDCLLAYLHPLVESAPDPAAEGEEIDPFDDIANDCRVLGYSGNVKATIYAYGVATYHMSSVVFFLDPESDSHDDLFYEAVGFVDTWVAGTHSIDGCVHSSPAVRHGIPTSEEVDHPMTSGFMTLALWTDPPSLVAGGSAFIDLTVTTRCPTPQGIVTRTADVLPPWAWLSTGGVPLPFGDDLKILSGSFTAPDETEETWSTWEWHLQAHTYD
jgi:hypothetical protein